MPKPWRQPRDLTPLEQTFVRRQVVMLRMYLHARHSGTPDLELRQTEDLQRREYTKAFNHLQSTGTYRIQRFLARLYPTDTDTFTCHHSFRKTRASSTSKRVG